MNTATIGHDRQHRNRSLVRRAITWQLAVVRGCAIALLVIILAVSGLTSIANLKSAASDAEVLGHPVLVVMTGSMEPTIPVGSLILLNKVSNAQTNALRVGDIVAFHPAVGPADVVVTHRIVAVRNVGSESAPQVAYTTQGDANQSPDLTPLDPSRVVGVYDRHIPIVGRLIQGLGQWQVVVLIIFSLLFAQIALEQRPLRGIFTRRKHIQK